MPCIKKKAMMEPLVDTVDQNQIVIDSRLLKTMDISKMSSGDASFTAPFKLVAQRNDYLHALVAILMCHLPCATSFSTSQQDPNHGPHTGNKQSCTLKMC
ncbi:hypothetical protein N665_1788s0001 [Sinapis alba]|nr:hypothetical protein N665_1788s0001 [Sinapis alba]